MAFGTLGQTTTANCHTLVASQLTRQLNHNHSIAELAQVGETTAHTWNLNDMLFFSDVNALNVVISGITFFYLHLYHTH